MMIPSPVPRDDKPPGRARSPIRRGICHVRRGLLCDFSAYRINPMSLRLIIIRCAKVHLLVHESRTSRPTGDGDHPMKNLILAAFAALSLTAAIAPLANAATFHNGSSIAGDAAATRTQQTGGYSH